MDMKLDIYDALGIILPGVLVVFLVSMLFPTAGVSFSGVGFPDGFAVIALLSLSAFVGYLIQSLSSLIEPALFLTWGGMPPGKALRTGLGERYLPEDSAKRIHRKLVDALGEHATDRSVYLFAVQRAEGTGRVPKFNSLYAFHRALVTTFLLGLFVLIGASCWGALAEWSPGGKLSLFGGWLAVTLLLWYRAKQRSLYYTREVLLTAERLIEGGIMASSSRINTFGFGEDDGKG